MLFRAQRWLSPFIGGLVLAVWPVVVGAATMEELLLAEPAAKLAAVAAREGNATRGAAIFFRADMACHKCHVVDGAAGTPGPDLARLDSKTSNVALVESVLTPSMVIATGFEPTALDLADGRTVIGIIDRETADEIILRDASQPGVVLTLPRKDVQQRTALKQSIMPAGQVNQLASRQEFLDIVRYLMELRDGGPRRARELQPAPQLLVLQIPEYEKRVDHAGLIRSLGDPNYDRGEAIYSQLCINCHGTKHQPGSLPTALRFGSGKFKNGNDPHAMYRTLTHGYGMMTPQSWMVPQQKYDVIHYIREEYLKNGNKTQYFAITPEYLADLPRGDTRGPEPKKIEPWKEMDYGPSLTNVYQFGNDGGNLAYKGIAVRLEPDAGAAPRPSLGGVTHGSRWMAFDHDTLRMAGAWHGQGFIDFAGIQFNGAHGVHAHVAGQISVANPPQPGWGRPEDGSFADPRLVGTDGLHYGPLPRAWAHLRGYYYHGQQVVISYTVGRAEVLELPGLTGDALPIYTRTLNIGPRDKMMVLQVAKHPGELHVLPIAEGQRSAVIVKGADLGTANAIVAGVAPLPTGAEWISTDGALRLRIPAGSQQLRLTVWMAAAGNEADVKSATAVRIEDADRDLTPLTHGGPPRWPQRPTTHQAPGADNGPFAVDVLTLPLDNPWKAQMRLTGLDFLPDGDRAAICSWDGDVWMVSGLNKLASQLVWQRIASGLFQPLGLKMIKGKIYVTCRDQIVVLNDLNGDGETDFYENFNNDHQVTAHFHEFAMGLQTDAAGNLYYAKAACHARPALVPQHGTLLRVSPDGLTTDIIARGFRAPNGVCVNADGTFFMTDQEGHWLPKNRINHVVPGGFYGNMLGYGAPKDNSDSAMQPPVCWITNAFDRSPAEMLWVEGAAWRRLRGSLLNLSYGYGKLFVVPHEQVEGVWQGGMCELPVPALPTGIIRGRFNPNDGQLYVCGMYAWAGSATQPGGFYRIRATGKPANMPVALAARKDRLAITLSDPLDAASVADIKNYSVRVWSLKRTKNYGSQHHDEHPLKVKNAELAADGRTIELLIPDLAPTWCMEVKYDIKGKDGTPIVGKIDNTIHKLGPG